MDEREREKSSIKKYDSGRVCMALAYFLYVLVKLSFKSSPLHT
jgi:hypothetical protein